MARTFWYLLDDGTASGAITEDNSEGAYSTLQGSGSSWASTFSGVGEYFGDIDAIRAATGETLSEGDLILIGNDSTKNFGGTSRSVDIPNGVALISVDESADLAAYEAPSVDLMQANDGTNCQVYSGGVGHGSALASFFKGIRIKSGRYGVIGGACSFNRYHDCRYDITRSINNMYTQITNTNDASDAVLVNTSILHNTTYDQYVILASGGYVTYLGGEIRGGSICIFQIPAGARINSFKAIGTNFSNSPSGSIVAEYLDADGTAKGYIHLYRCDLPATYTRQTGLTSLAGGCVIIEGCDSENQFEYENSAGVIEVDTSVYYTTSELLADGTSRGSYKFTTQTGSVNDFSPLSMDMSLMDRWIMAANDDVATNGNVRIHFVVESAGSLDSADVCFYVINRDSTTNYHCNVAKHSVLPSLESGATLSTETSKWTGSGLGTQYYFDIALNSPGDGDVFIMPGLMKENISVWFSLDPEFVA